MSNKKILIISIFCCLLRAKQELPIGIIGGGLAGLSAALYLARAQTPYILFEKEQILGGQANKAIYENWPGIKQISGGDLIAHMKEQLTELNEENRTGSMLTDTQVDAIDQHVDGSFTVTYTENVSTKNKESKKTAVRALIIATGAQPNKLGIPAEEKYLGTGSLYVCATCDAPLVKDKKVVVIGGGYEALRELGIIQKYTTDITLINKGSALSGPKMLTNIAHNNKNIKIYNDTTALDIVGDEKKATGVKVRDNKTNQEHTIDADAIFIAIGWKPAPHIKGSVKVNRIPQGEVKTENTATNVSGIFAAGDASSETHHQAITASAHGYAAAMQAERYLCHQDNPQLKVCE